MSASNMVISHVCIPNAAGLITWVYDVISGQSCTLLLWRTLCAKFVLAWSGVKHIIHFLWNNFFCLPLCLHCNNYYREHEIFTSFYKSENFCFFIFWHCCFFRMQALSVTVIFVSVWLQKDTFFFSDFNFRSFKIHEE